LLAAAAYLAISGGNVATERAFVMAAVMLVAVMLDRRAVSLRSVAIAALIVLSLRPEALMGPGFQMSFAATTALVACYGWMRDADWSLPGPRWAHWISGVILSSLIAGLATAPIAAAHFNAVAHYGLLANVLSVPLMGSIVIPSAVLAACLAPLGFEAVGLTVMGWGIRWILAVAERVSGLDGARSFVASPDVGTLPLLALGGLILFLWQGRGRCAALLPFVAAASLWAGSDRPAMLIAEGGLLVGVMGPEGRALSKPRGAGFVAQVWIENDGERISQTEAAARWPNVRDGVARMRLDQWEVVHLTTKRAAATMSACSKDQILISAHPLSLRGPCIVLGPDELAGQGSLAVWDGALVSAGQITGNRLWNGNRRPGEQGQAALLRVRLSQ
jgi:competence protein ComEC